MTAERKAHLDAAAFLTLVACCAIWGVSQVAAKVSLTLRLLVALAAACLGIALVNRATPARRRPT